MENLDAFLAPTRYCNFNNPIILKTAFKITKNCKTEREKITKLFSWVKEKIKFKFDHWNITALETLKKKTGMCTNKSNLLVAFLRAINIPAGFGRLKIMTSQFYGTLMCPVFKKLVSPQSTHIYVGIFFEGRWLRCDPSVDKELRDALIGKSPFAEITGFDINDEEIKKIKGILKREEFLANIDVDLDKPPKRATSKTLEFINYYLLFLRQNKKKIPKISTVEEIEKIFFQWLNKKKYHPHFCT